MVGSSEPSKHMQSLRRLGEALPTALTVIALLLFVSVVALPGAFGRDGHSSASAVDGVHAPSGEAGPADQIAADRSVNRPVQLAQATFVRQDVYDDAIEIRPQAIDRSACGNGCIAGRATVTTHRVKERYWSRAPSHVGREALRNGGDVTVIAVPVIR